MATTDTFVFNASDCFIEGWYWVLRSGDLKKRQTKNIKLLGRNLVLYRSETGIARALDAYCPHMGAHLAEGKVEGEHIRCLFHFWKFDNDGNCIEIPCQSSTKGVPKIKPWPIQEKYGLIWIWTGDTPRWQVPFVPELENSEIDWSLGGTFTKSCHPNVMMINAIDAQHFRSVHNLPVKLDLQPKTYNENHIVFSNATTVPQSNILTRFIARFYNGPLTYILSYWYGSTGSVTIGPDFLHFHILFSLRPTPEGKSEGQTVLITKKRSGISGAIINWILLRLTAVVGNYFAKGDTLIFESINFKMRFPIKADSAIVSFVKHAEKQRVLSWGQWTRVDPQAQYPIEKGASNYEQPTAH
jgi:phenylpropionate dioxygenase-like ring-hydroxylating dioxygenase large terminal subunit